MKNMGNMKPSGTMLSQGNITWIFLNCISYLFNFLPDGESIPLTHNLTCIYWDKQLFFSMYTNNNNVIISISLLNNSSTNAIFQRLYTLFYKNHSDFPCCIFKLTCFLSPIILWNQTFNSGRISIYKISKSILNTISRYPLRSILKSNLILFKFSLRLKQYQYNKLTLPSIY